MLKDKIIVQISFSPSYFYRFYPTDDSSFQQSIVLNSLHSSPQKLTVIHLALQILTLFLRYFHLWFSFISWYFVIYTLEFTKSKIYILLFVNIRDRETWVRSLGQEDLLEEGMATHSQPTPVFLPGESLEQRSLVGYSA